jgi:hypothetical protein
MYFLPVNKGQTVVQLSQAHFSHLEPSIADSRDTLADRANFSGDASFCRHPNYRPSKCCHPICKHKNVDIIFLRQHLLIQIQPLHKGLAIWTDMAFYFMLGAYIAYIHILIISAGRTVNPCKINKNF